jgi:transposase-like protein
MTETNPTPRKRLTPDERDRIIEMRLDRVPVRTIAAEIKTTTRTVQETWKRWLRETAEERRAVLDESRAEAIARLDRIATDARLGALRARRDGDDSAVARYLDTEQRALVAGAKLEGLDMPTRIEHTGADGGPIEVMDPKAELLARLARLQPPES